MPPCCAPACRTGLALSDRQGVEINYCPSCRGVWLDRVEFDKIIKRAGPEFSPGRTSGLGGVAERMLRCSNGDDNYHYGRRKWKKSFLSELFD